MDKIAELIHTRLPYRNDYYCDPETYAIRCTELAKEIREELAKEKNKKRGEIPFETFWNLYDKKVGKISKIKMKWGKLTTATQEKALNHIEKYKKSQPEKRFRKNPEAYLNNESWNDEIIYSEELKKKNQGFTWQEACKLNSGKFDNWYMDEHAKWHEK